jgi:hypothetical protein
MLSPPKSTKKEPVSFIVAREIYAGKRYRLLTDAENLLEIS